MSNGEQAIPIAPRRHYHELRYDERTGGIVGDAFSGRLMAETARAFAPDAEKTRRTLLALRKDFGLARGHLAALLAVTEGTLKAWERGKRRPSFLARRLIWFVDNSLRATSGDGFDILTWGQPSRGAPESD